MTSDVLIVDDQADICKMVSGLLGEVGHSCHAAHDGDTVMAEVSSRNVDLVLLDIWLKDSRFGGMEILRDLQQRRPELPVVMMSGHGTIDTAVEAIKLGAYDFVEKPIDADRLVITVDRALREGELLRACRDLHQRAGTGAGLIGRSKAVRSLRGVLSKVAPTDSRVLIQGPPGSGKETFARHLHERSRRSRRSFVVLSCASITPERMEKELFGEDGPGAFSPEHMGALAAAHRGTLLLDEICDIPLETQGKFVRVLHDMSFTRDRRGTPVPIDVRVVAASSRDVEERIAAGQFRQDLYYRLNVVPVRVPPLRERREDIPDLVSHFMGESARASSLPERRLSPEAMARLQVYGWPGNVRQLRNVVDWLLIMAPGGPGDDIGADALPPEVADGGPQAGGGGLDDSLFTVPLREARSEFERRYLDAQVSRFGTVAEAAEFIGMERTALHRKLKLLGITGHSPPLRH